MKKLFKFFLKLWTVIGVLILIPIIILLAVAVMLVTGYSVIEVLWWATIFGIIFAVPISFIRKNEIKRLKKKIKKAEQEE